MTTRKPVTTLLLALLLVLLCTPALADWNPNQGASTQLIYDAQHQANPSTGHSKRSPAPEYSLEQSGYTLIETPVPADLFAVSAYAGMAAGSQLRLVLTFGPTVQGTLQAIFTPSGDTTNLENTNHSLFVQGDSPDDFVTKMNAPVSAPITPGAPQWYYNITGGTLHNYFLQSGDIITFTLLNTQGTPISTYHYTYQGP